MTEIFLVLGCFQSKNNGKYYITGRTWDPDRKMWKNVKQVSGGYGDRILEINKDMYDKVLPRLQEPVCLHLQTSDTKVSF